VKYTPCMRLCPFVLLAALLAVAPAACNDADDDIRANVTLLCNHEGALATAAADHLTRYGRRAIPTIESAMHTASPTGKKNLILALRKIGDVEAVPLLGHMAQFEPNADVRREAEWTLRGWATDDKAKDRAERAKAAVRTLEEAHGTQDAG
jgi:hypothetical protein